MKTVEEADVGISCYISNLPGFRGILKQRYSDFIVNEVDVDGNVIHLTNLEAPPEVVEEKKIEVSDQLSSCFSAAYESFKSVAGDADAESLKAFIDQICSGVKDLSPIILSASSDKSHRTAVHNFFKEHLKFLVTDTVDGPDTSSKCIRVWFNAGGNDGTGRNSKKRKDRGGKPCDSRNSDNWPENLDKFVRFHLYKENKDTQEALGIIAKMLGVQPRSFGFSGTKDKRSVSTQRVTIYRQRASKLAALNKRLIGIKVGNFCYVKEGLVLGKLYGNRFTVTLRGVIADSEATIEASASALGKQGFINYFGLQRFGSGSVPTHRIGATLLRGEWKAAVSIILDPREGEKDFIRKVREYYTESGDIDGTLKQLPRHLVAEKSILQSLKRCPSDYLQALKAIPRTLRMMYVHSYQSYLWNHAASMRVQKHGTNQVVLGDLVFCRGECTEIDTVTTNPPIEENNGIDTFEYGESDEIAETILPEERSNLVKHIDEEDLVAGNYTIEDVILPLPGSKVIYPSNDIGEVYATLAKKDGISLTESVHNVKEFSITNMTGAYRRVFQKPQDFKWELLSYTDGNIPLAETDIDIISKSRPAGGKTEDSKNGNEDAERNEDSRIEEDGGVEVEELQPQITDHSNVQESQLALKMSFTLPSSCYATMAVRELLKTSTSVCSCNRSYTLLVESKVEGYLVVEDTNFETVSKKGDLMLNFKCLSAYYLVTHNDMVMSMCCAYCDLFESYVGSVSQDTELVTCRIFPDARHRPTTGFLVRILLSHGERKPTKTGYLSGSIKVRNI